MMNGTDVASPQTQTVSTLLNSSSTHGVTPTGVVPVDHPSCKKARKRPRIESSPSSANYNPSPSSSSPASSRVTKPNKPKRHRTESSVFSSLAGSPFRQSTVADVAVATSIAAAAAAATTREELGATRHQLPETKWDPSIPLDPPSYGGGLTASDTGRDHFTLSSPTLAQTQQGPDVYNDWNSNVPDQLGLNNLSLSMFHSQPPYLPAHENLPHETLSRSYSANYPDTTTQAVYLPAYFEALPTPNMVKTYREVDNAEHVYHGSPPLRIPPEAGPSSMARPEPSTMGGVDGDYDIIRNPGSVNNYHISWSNLDLPHRDLPGPVDEEPWETVVAPTVDEVAAQENHPSSHPGGRSRSRLNGAERMKTGNTRKLKKIRCDPDPDDPQGGDCLTCRNINLDSKKVIHRLPCLRWKLAEIVLFREGGLNLTQRWTGVKMKDLSPRDWANNQVRTIRITIGCRYHPLKLSVRKFMPNRTDITWKYWVDRNGVKRKLDIEPYALADIWKTAREYEEYVYMYAGPALHEYIETCEDHVVRSTYKAALRYAMKLQKHPHTTKGDDVDPSQFLHQYFCLWFGIRNTLGSAFIVGEDTLDMAPNSESECPYYGKINIPRMIPAQFDSLGHEVVLAPLRKQVLEGLWKMMSSKNPHHFFTIYLTVFMMLHEVSVTSADRRRRAKENKVETLRYDLASFVEKLQEGANNVLTHWHYYRRGVDVDRLMNIGAGDSSKKGVVWEELTPTEVQLLVETQLAYKQYKETKAPDQNLEWEHDLFFVSQMFDELWSPGKTFNW